MVRGAGVVCSCVPTCTGCTLRTGVYVTECRIVDCTAGGAEERSSDAGCCTT